VRPGKQEGEGRLQKRRERKEIYNSRQAERSKGVSLKRAEPSESICVMLDRERWSQPDTRGGKSSEQTREKWMSGGHQWRKILSGGKSVTNAEEKRKQKSIKKATNRLQKHEPGHV